MGKVPSSPLERGEVSVAARARGPADVLSTFADDQVFDTLERGEIIRLGLAAFREQRRQKPSAPKQGQLFH
jgi:hypothetical protein